MGALSDDEFDKERRLTDDALGKRKKGCRSLAIQRLSKVPTELKMLLLIVSDRNMS